MTDDSRNGWWHFDSESSYGIFPAGHDPCAFAPDPQATTSEERGAYLEACEAARRGERRSYPHGAFGMGAIFESPAVWIEADGESTAGELIVSRVATRPSREP